jgi:hypothetical protein
MAAPKITMSKILCSYPQYSRDFIIHVLEDYVEDITDKDKKLALGLTIDRWKLGWDEDELSEAIVKSAGTKMAKDNPITASMKAVVAKTKELEKNLPEKPEQLIDTFVIGKYPGGDEVRLIKDKNHIQLAIVKKWQIKNSIELDESIMDGIIGMSGRGEFNPWESVLNRLPAFREYIESEAKKT